MAQLAIKGHATRGKEVIEILEMLGGENVRDVKGCGTESSYYIDKKGIIDFSLFNTKTSKEGCMILTIEQFLEKYPYKVGDKVIHNGNIEIVNRMRWDGDTIKYGFFTTRNIGELTVENLQPYIEAKEETKKDLDWHPTDYLEFVDNDEWADEVELNLGNSYKIQIRCGKTYAVKKKPQYPKTYKECCDILGISTMDNDAQGYKGDLIIRFQELLIARDAYWKIAGDWKPDWKTDEDGYNTVKFCIKNFGGEIRRIDTSESNTILAFPTEEMRDAFYENFKELIESVKELL